MLDGLFIIVYSEYKRFSMKVFIVTGKMNGGEFKVSEVLATSRVNAKTIALLSGYARVAQVIAK